LLLAPRRSSFDYASDRYTGKPSSKLASSSSTYRSVNPGTESIIVKAAALVN
jgi:hypothetical protein